MKTLESLDAQEMAFAEESTGTGHWQPHQLELQAHRHCAVSTASHWHAGPGPSNFECQCH